MGITHSPSSLSQQLSTTNLTQINLTSLTYLSWPELTLVQLPKQVQRGWHQDYHETRLVLRSSQFLDLCPSLTHSIILISQVTVLIIQGNKVLSSAS